MLDHMLAGFDLTLDGSKDLNFDIMDLAVYGKYRVQVECVDRSHSVLHPWTLFVSRTAVVN